MSRPVPAWPTLAALLSFALPAVAQDRPAAPAEPQVATGLFEPGAPYVPPPEHAPAQISRTMVMTTVSVDGRAALDVPATGAGRLLVWTVKQKTPGAGGAGDAPAVNAVVRTPSGRVLRSGETASDDGRMRRLAIGPPPAGLDVASAPDALEIRSAEAGVHRLEVDLEPAATLTVLAAEPESPLTLGTWAAPLSRAAGQPVVLHAELRDAPGPLTGARLTARLTAPGGSVHRAIPMRDDGRAGDLQAGDGLYTAVLKKLPGEAPGFWSVQFEAAGTTRAGTAFARTGWAGFVNERPLARLRAVRAQRDGATVRVRTRVDVSAAGLYRLEVIVASGAPGEGRSALAWGELSLNLANGRAPLAIEVPLPAADLLEPLSVEVRLLGLAPMGVAGRAEVNVN